MFTYAYALSTHHKLQSSTAHFIDNFVTHFRKTFCRKRPTLQHPKWVLLFSLLPTILYWDYYEYYFPKWFNIDCQNEEDCTRILLVADPQIIGLRNEMIHFITPISIWDSDRYDS